MLEILFCGTKIEANSRNSVLNYPRKRKQLEIPFRGTKIEANSRNSVPKHFFRQKYAAIMFEGAGIFAKHIFFPVIPFHSEFRNRLFRKPWKASERVLSSAE
jgi:hypothetical protein